MWVRKEVNWEKMVDFWRGLVVRRSLSLVRRASILAEEREVRRRRVICWGWVGVWVGIGVVGEVNVGGEEEGMVSVEAAAAVEAEARVWWMVGGVGCVLSGGCEWRSGS